MSLISASTAAPSETIDAQFEAGRTLLSGGHPLEALAAFQRLLQSKPADEQGELGLAEAYRQLGNHDEARQVLERASREHPKSTAPLTSLAELEMGLQNYADALAAAQKAIRLEPGNRVARLDLATAYEAKGDSEGALRELDSVLSGSAKDPSDILLVDAYYLQAQIYAGRNEDVKAMTDLDRVTASAPDNSRARVLTAKVALRLNQCQKVIDELKPVINAHQEDADTLYMLSRAYKCTGQSDLADQTLSRYRQVSVDEHERHSREYDAARLVEQASALARDNHYEQALDLVREALEKYPASGDALILRAEIYHAQGALDPARAAAEAALNVNPYDPEYLYVMGKILKGKGDWKGAAESFEESTTVNPREAKAFLELGMAYAQLNDRARSLGALERAVELEPRNPQYRQALNRATAR